MSNSHTGHLTNNVKAVSYHLKTVTEGTKKLGTLHTAVQGLINQSLKSCVLCHRYNGSGDPLTSNRHHLSYDDCLENKGRLQDCSCSIGSYHCIQCYAHIL